MPDISLADLLSALSQRNGVQGLMTPVGDVIKGPQSWYQRSVDLGGDIARPIVPPMGAVPGGGKVGDYNVESQSEADLIAKLLGPSPLEGLMQFRPRDTRTQGQKYRDALMAQKGQVPYEPVTGFGEGARPDPQAFVNRLKAYEDDPTGQMNPSYWTKNKPPLWAKNQMYPDITDPKKIAALRRIQFDSELSDQDMIDYLAASRDYFPK